MIRLLHILPDFKAAGAQKLVMDMLLCHDKVRFDAAACSLFPEGNTWIEDELKRQGIKIFYLNKHLGPDIKVLRKLFELFKAFKPDVVHSHTYVLRYILLPALVCGIPVKIHTVHNIAKKEVDLAGRIIHRIAFKLLNVFPVGVSQEISKTISKLYKIKVVQYIYNGVPTEAYIANRSTRQALRASIKISNERFICLHIGRFSAQKNHRLLIEAFTHVLKEIPDAILLMAGDGELRSEMEKFTQYLGLEKSVRFLGTRKDVPELLAACDLLVLSSDWEGAPIVVLEAMAAGKPVVATAVGGVSDLVIQRETGLLVPPRNAYALACAISRIYKNPSRAIEMGQRGRRIVKTRFDTKEMTQQYETLYLNLIGAGCRVELD
jgi:glycosyltransferase involved in cell wall biosynthesis